MATSPHHGNDHKIDTKESLGGKDFVRRFKPKAKIYRYTKHINDSWYLPIAEK